MKSVKVEDEVHANLVAFAAYLTMQVKKKVTLSNAIEHLLENVFQNEVLEAKK